MKYLAIIDDSMLSNFRRDDDGLTMVVTDEAGASRGIILHPVFEAKPIVIFDGKAVYLNQDCTQLLYDFERQKLLEEHFKSIEESFSDIDVVYSCARGNLKTNDFIQRCADV